METPYAIPQDPLVAEMVERLDAGQREDYEERAAIIEFDGQIQRGHAECLALLDVLRRNPTALTSLVAMLTSSAE